ncbi:TIGR03960 family B12-binding radical SAM protein [Chloroflexota bacterium]
MIDDLDSILYKVNRPARYTGGEWNSVVKAWESAEVRVALSYPDIYEIGMSNFGLAIIYDLVNKKSGVLAERVFAPWVDMETEMRRLGIPLFTLESRRPVRDFDIFGFSQGYEMTYTNVLNMLDLAGIPLFAAQRDDAYPLVVAGGSCSVNPEPMADFFDLFIIGEGEEVTGEFLEAFRRWKNEGSGSKEKLLRAAAGITGIYIPGFYTVDYHPQGTVASITPTVDEAKPSIERRIVSKLSPPLTRPIVPHLQAVHDRAAVEIQRGCPNGCRFCQAGMIYRPLRERTHDEVVRTVGEIIENCGYEEFSLLSLSTSDYSDISNLVSKLSQRYRDKHLMLSLPSLRPDSFSVKLADSLRGRRKGGLTFAPEAGTERLRHVINKGTSEEEVLRAIETASERGWRNLKLYFVIGLPTETEEDIEGIVELVRKIRYASKGKMNVKVSASTFVPKPHTPFQWAAQVGEEELAAKHQMLRAGLRKLGAHLSWQEPSVSLLEAVLARGDRRLGRVIHRAWELGCKFDAWSEHYSYDTWQRAFEETGLDPQFYALRERPQAEVMPWSHIDTGVEPGFLWREYQRSKQAIETPSCRDGDCTVCGLHRSQADCKKKYQELINHPQAAIPATE